MTRSPMLIASSYRRSRAATWLVTAPQHRRRDLLDPDRSYDDPSGQRSRLEARRGVPEERAVELGEHMPHEAGGRSASGVDLDVGITYGGLGFLLGGLGGCLVLLSRDLGVPRGELSWLSAGFGVALLLAGLVGPRALRLGAGWVLRTGCA